MVLFIVFDQFNDSPRYMHENIHRGFLDESMTIINKPICKWIRLINQQMWGNSFALSPCPVSSGFHLREPLLLLLQLPVSPPLVNCSNIKEKKKKKKRGKRKVEEEEKKRGKTK